MKYTQIWSEQVKGRDGSPVAVYDVVISPDELSLLVGAENKILVYDIASGVLRQTLKGHKEAVYCLSYSHDAKRFASGSADKQVIIWTSKLEAILKYTHNDSVRCIAYNPKSHQLLSCTASDFGLWSPEQKTVAKTKVLSQINCCVWNDDGSCFAIGMNSGTISIRLKNGEEKLKIERGSNAPIWALLFFETKSSEGQTECLAVADWSQMLTFYSASNGAQSGNSRSLGFDALFLTFMTFDEMDFILVGGSNCKTQIYTTEGILLDALCTQKSWVWTCKVSHNLCAIACENGTVALFEVSNTTVHSLYKERYAFRDSMTDVVVQHLLTGEKARIKCRDLVKKIAVYEKSLAIQLSDRVVIYELGESDDSPDRKTRKTEMTYKVKEKLPLKTECSLLVLCASNLVFCQEKRLESVRLSDAKVERDWTFNSPIRYVKTLGGVPGKEALIVVLKNGQIVNIYLNNMFHFESFPKLGSNNSLGPIRFIDLSAKHRKIALLDERSKLAVFDLESLKCIFEKSNVTSAAFNSDEENLLAMIHDGDSLGTVFFYKKDEDYKVYKQIAARDIAQKSFIIGYSSEGVHILQTGNVVFEQRINYSTLLHSLLRDQLALEDCYRMACLNVTTDDWNYLARLALSSLELDIARKCFRRIDESRFSTLLKSVDSTKLKADANRRFKFEAELAALEGQFSEAAKIYRTKMKQDELAYDMFTELQMFDQARDYATGEKRSVAEPLGRLGELAVTRKGPIEGAYGPDGVDSLLDRLRRPALSNDSVSLERSLHQIAIEQFDLIIDRLDKGETRLLSAIGQFLTEKGHFGPAVAAFNKSGDVSGLVTLYSQTGRWSEALQLMLDYGSAKSHIIASLSHPDLARSLFSKPVQFDQAQNIFEETGQSDQLETILKDLLENSVKQNRFDDCSYFSWLLSRFYRRRDDQTSFRRYAKHADIYYTYNNIYKFIEEPFTSIFIEILFNCALFLYRFIDSELPEGVSKVNILFALAKLGKTLRHFKLVRLVYAKLQQNFVLPARFEELIEIGSIEIRTKPFADDEELVKFCYRCSATNAFTVSSASSPEDSPDGDDRCFNCAQPFVYSFYSFDTLPLVEFEIDLSNDTQSAYTVRSDSEQVLISDSHQVLQIADDHSAGQLRVLNGPDSVVSPTSNLTVLTSGQLARLNAASVIVVRDGERKRFFLNALPEIAVVSCESCLKFFYSDEFEFQRLKNGCCPFCRS